MIRSLRYTLSFFLSAAVILVSGCSSSNRSVEEPVPTAEYTSLNPHSIVFEWQDAYEQKLKEFASSNSFRNGTGGSMFDLRDIDGDGTPELMISPDYGISTLCEIYTFADGKLKELDTGESGGGGVFGYISFKKLYNFVYSGDGFEIGKYCSLSDGVFKQEIAYFNNSRNAIATGTMLRYEINGETVGLTDYDKALSNYNSDYSLTLGRKYTFDNKTIDYALRYSESWGTVLAENGRKQYRNLLADYMDSAEKSAGFELCDLNGDNQPELILSEGDYEGAVCRIYTIENGLITEVCSGIGSNGTVFMDTESSIVYAYNAGKHVCWSFDEGELSDYKPSESYTELGRKHLLTPESITSALH